MEIKNENLDYVPEGYGFTQQNTDFKFTDREIKFMNRQLKRDIIDNEVKESDNYLDSIIKNLTEKILNEAWNEKLKNIKHGGYNELCNNL